MKVNNLTWDNDNINEIENVKCGQIIAFLSVLEGDETYNTCPDKD